MRLRNLCKIYFYCGQNKNKLKVLCEITTTNFVSIHINTDYLKSRHIFSSFYFYHICSVMVNVLAFSVVDYGFKSLSGQAKTIKLVFVASPLSTQH
jgi:hypothetical protein